MSPVIPREPHVRRALRIAALLGSVLTVILVGGALVAPHALGLAAGGTAASAEPQPLSPEQEARRVQQANELYGSPDIKPLGQRKTLAVSMGDSQMSGEGAWDRSLYDPNTDREGNYCHRQREAVGVKNDLPVDLKMNIACSGAQTFQVLSTRQGGTYWFGENQGDQLEVLARNTHVKYIYIFIGANDPEGLNFGPRLTDCVERRVWLRPSCWRDHTQDASRAVGVVETNVTAALKAVKQTMTEAGYAPTDYQFIVGGYPSPIDPNWNAAADPYGCGGMIWEADTYFARNKVVPMFADAIQRAAANAHVQFLDMRTAFDGHAPCSGQAWVTGLFNMGSIFTDNDWRQSFHPNSGGHAAFNRCFTAAFASQSMTQTCSVKAGDYWPSVTEGLHEQVEVKNVDTGLCLGTHDGKTGDSYRVESVVCHGSELTSLVYDSRDNTVHHPQAYNKCWDVWQGNLAPGGELSTFQCSGAANQKFVFHDDGTIRPATAQHLCVDAGRWGEDDVFGAWVQLRDCNPSDSRQVFSVQQPANTQGRLQLSDGSNQCIQTSGGFAANTPLTLGNCGYESQVWKLNAAPGDAFITEMQGVLCFDAPPWAGGVLKIVPCGYHDFAYKQYGRFAYDGSQYLVYQPNPDLVVSGWGPGKQLTLDYRGRSAQQSFSFVQDASVPQPGEGYSDWLPLSLNGA
ncbi:ricin-type beta-trefoil lectin domain protein [Micrococcales bacterium 31B]|nr:ricin-type beta-trefoil lectin domain protein [Micrococcales bacterium 31B]